MNKQRRTETIIDHMKCLLRYFPSDELTTILIQKEICKGCEDEWVCKYVWRPFVKQQIKGILDDELKEGVIHEKD